MKTLINTFRKTECNSDSVNRTIHLQYVISEQLFLTFHSAVKILELTAAQHPEKLRKEFSNAFEPYQRTELIARILEGRLSIISGLEPNCYGREARDLFLALSPETQAKLKEQGINYE